MPPLDVARFCESLWENETYFDPPEGRKTQTPGHKSMVEGLTIMLGVFRDLLYTYAMPNNHY